MDFNGAFRFHTHTSSFILRLFILVLKRHRPTAEIVGRKTPIANSSVYSNSFNFFFLFSSGENQTRELQVAVSKLEADRAGLGRDLGFVTLSLT